MMILFFLRYYRDQASSRVRGFYVAEELEKRGVKSSIICGENREGYLKFFSKLINHEIFYFQKRYSKSDIYLNKLARLLSKKTFFDLDDAPGGVKLNPEVERQAAEMMTASSAVVVGSHKLKDFAQNYNDHVYLIPSSINLNYYMPSGTKSSNYITLGWIGNGINYKNDLQMLIEPLKKLGRKYNIKLVLVGALGQKEIHQKFNSIRNIKVEIIDSIEWENPTEAPSVISRFDIGLYPLLNNQYNEYKCGYKALEYMAMKIPVVASPVGENKFIIENGKDGFLASNEKDWEEYLSYLIENESIRKRMGEMGRIKVEKNYSLEVCTEKLKGLLKE